MRNVQEHNARREQRRAERRANRRASRRLLAELARADAALHIALDARSRVEYN